MQGGSSTHYQKFSDSISREWTPFNRTNPMIYQHVCYGKQQKQLSVMSNCRSTLHIRMYRGWPLWRQLTWILFETHQFKAHLCSTLRKYGSGSGRSLLSVLCVHFLRISALFHKAYGYGPNGAVPLETMGRQCFCHYSIRSSSETQRRNNNGGTFWGKVLRVS